ncbi:MAG: alpha-2-macroglobulin, partial [Planctomycetia bacterium]
YSTKDTAIVCDALADYLKATNELDPDLTVTVDVDGRASKTFHFTKENLFTGETDLTLSGDMLAGGAHAATVSMRGRGNVYWSAVASAFSREDELPATGHELFVERTYYKVTPKTAQAVRKVVDPKTRKLVDEKYTVQTFEKVKLADGAVLKSGDLLEVELAVDARNNFEYVMIEDPKPAGCEPTDQQSGYSWGVGRQELRDEKVAFFTSFLNRGKHMVRYMLRAEAPGVYHALPARAECMYAPLARGNSTGRTVDVAE